MRFYQYLKDEYFGITKSRYSRISATLFRNPDKSELKEIGREVRFIIDTKYKGIYCWKANDALHDEMEDFIADEHPIGKIITGEGIISGGKINRVWELKSSDIKPQIFMKMNLPWLMKYFVMSQKDLADFLEYIG